MSQRWIIEAEVMPKQGVNDPQGDAVMSGLKSLQFNSTERVRVGKLIRIEVRADSEDDAIGQGTRMCESLLANPVIEEFVVSAAPIE
jgi:phosphoribosylformylglycinamidine synthase subunit PurS